MRVFNAHALYSCFVPLNQGEKYEIIIRNSIWMCHFGIFILIRTTAQKYMQL